jgi:hypothetical protein
MTLPVETGTGSSTAESYCTEAFATAYHAARGNSAWEDVEDAEANLRKATEYMLQSYRARWKGCRVNSVQALDWPRYDVVVDGYAVDSDTVPLEIQKACAELALRAISNDLLADQTQGIVREKVGPLEVEYDKSSTQTIRFKAVDALLAPFLNGSGLMVQRV